MQHWLDHIHRIGAVNEAARAKTVPALYEQIRYLEKAMFAAGFPRTNATSYAVAVIMLESDWMTSNLANTMNNYSGIKFVNQKFATIGPKSPEGGNYARYANLTDFCRDFLRVLSLNTGKKGKPIDATTATEFVSRLLANHYFTDPNYVTKWNAAYKRVYEAVAYGKGQESKYTQQSNNGQNTFTYDSDKGLTPNAGFNADRKATQLQHWVEDHPVLAGAAGLGIVIVLVKLVEGHR